MKKKSLQINIRPILFFLLTVLFSFCLGGCGNAEPVSRSDFYFDTIITITLYDAPSESLLDHCFEIASDYEQMLSKTVEGSDIWNINHSGGSEVSINRETYDLLSRAMYYARLTDGRLDLTIGTVSDLWNFSSENDTHKVPSDDKIREALTHVNYQNVVIKQNGDQYTAALTDSKAQIDLGFIAKGYIADQMKQYLLSENVQSGIINLGGNVLTLGSKPDKSSYKIGIKKPFKDDESPIEVLSVVDKSVVTSGIYERYFYQDGQLYHHILDTGTGYPISNNLYSVTILSSSSMDGDALSTACLILGLDKGMELIEQTADCEAVFVTDDYRIYNTSGL
ncbi:MAG: FAD:protein FMN transferase [Lachnospiraceae bacterium]